MPGTPTGDGFSARKCNRIAAAVIVGTKWHNEECCCHKNAGKEQVAAASHFASSFDSSLLSTSAPSEVDGIADACPLRCGPARRSGDRRPRGCSQSSYTGGPQRSLRLPRCLSSGRFGRLSRSVIYFNRGAAQPTLDGWKTT